MEGFGSGNMDASMLEIRVRVGYLAFIASWYMLKR